MNAPWPVMLMARELDLGGSERQLAEIARSLDRSLFRPYVGCFRASGLRADSLRAANVPIVEIPVRSFISPSTLAAAFRMGRFLRRHGIRLVHTFDVPATLFGVSVARSFHTPVVLSSQRAFRALTPHRRRHLRFIDHITDGVIVNCKAVERDLVQQEHLSPSRIHLCYNGIDTNLFRPAPTPRPEPLRGASLVIGTLCALRPEKDVATLLHAFSALRPSHPGLHLAIVGGGPLRDDLRHLSRRLGLEGCCHFEPAVADVVTWLRSIDVFVLPSLSEALSNSLMEAMASGCCAVASRTGGNPELVEHRRTGLLFQPGDPEDLALHLRALIENTSLRRTLATAGTAFIRNNFTLESAARRMGRIYTAFLRNLPRS